MQHVRIAKYRMTSGTPEEVAEIVQAPDGMLEKFQGHSGFIGYSLAKQDDGGLLSISVWESHAVAEEATGLAADWVEHHIASRLTLEWSSVGGALFNANALGN